MRAAAQLYTLRDYLKTPEDVEATLKRVKEIGYRAVQVSGLGPIDPHRLKEMADREGLTICATHIGFGELTDKLDEVIAQHRLWDCRYVGLGGMPMEYRSNEEGYRTFASIATEIGRKLRDAGLTFVYHNHDFEFAKWGERTGLQLLLEETEPEAVNFELDVYWVQEGGGDPVEWIRKVEGRMKVVHLKDMLITADREKRFAEVGEGNLNFVRILEACRETGVEWGAVEQDQCYGRDPFACLETSLRHLDRLGLDR
ncbi:sugar phosphate isomerase [Paenibacillus sp. J31TS4]|uniref:sugar phosphate isomerase/epimerase family protein n=1 Tax=Paenibacillus sp. J31TS4 TaxID=2807195 RepID=UPI001B059FA2|nr:sugar phosphate isomerase/epimerase [Paenibacillus sp. J31TS4]GIP40149.1 sugar phosphate isomerase [Paenibacillus sp. J31TS4]